MQGETLGIVCALQLEASALCGEVLTPGPAHRIAPGLLCVVVGIGACNAAAGVARLIAEGAAGVISWGFAGALAPGLAPGRLVCPTSVRYRDRVHRVDAGLWQGVYELTAAEFAPCTGEMVSVDDVVRSVEDKRRLYESSGAEAVDMESAAVLQEAGRQFKPATVIRAIVDASTTAVPDYVIDDGRPMRILAGLMRNPGSILDMGRLALGYRRARASLSAVGTVLKVTS